MSERTQEVWCFSFEAASLGSFKRVLVQILSYLLEIKENEAPKNMKNLSWVDLKKKKTNKCQHLKMYSKCAILI